MAGAGSFADKLALVLKALSMSRGRLAADMGVDKSLVGRWCAGSISPSPHNLARLSQTIAARVPDFTMLDWEADLPALAARFGVVVSTPAPVTQVPSGFAEWLALPKLQEVAADTAGTASAMCGFWRTTRPSPEFPGRFVHDRLIIEPTPDGPMSFRIGLFSSRLVGWSIAMGDQIYCCATNRVLGSSIFAIFNVVHRPRLDVLDGITVACMVDAGGVPMSAACLMERTGDLSGDRVADNARYEALLAEHPLAAEGSLPDAVMRHLLRDTGPTALKNGGDAMLMMRSMESMARGSDAAVET